LSDKIITLKDINYEEYNAKFKEWDDIEKKKDISSPRAIELLRDISIWSYALLRINGKKLKLYPYQDIITKSKNKRILVVGANQIGKSLLLDVMAAYHLCNSLCENTVIVSKSLPQARFQVSRIRNILNNSLFAESWRSETGDTESSALISLKVRDQQGKEIGLNRVIVAPCTEGLLGYDVHRLYLDEFDYYDIEQKHFFERIAQPRTYATKGQIMIFSNPNGIERYLYHLWTEKNLVGEQVWERYKFNYLSKPENTIKEYEDLRTSLDRVSFECTVAAIFSLGEKTFIEHEQLIESYDKKLNDNSIAIGKNVFFFLDVGIKRDRSVLTGLFTETDEKTGLTTFNIFIIKTYPSGYPLSLALGIKGVEEKRKWHYEKSVIEHLEEYKLEGYYPVIGVDVTNNQAIIPLLNTMGIKIVDTIFSGPKKWSMYQKIRYLFEKKLLKRCYHEDFIKELSELQVEITSRGYGKVHAIKGGFDDIPDSIVGCVSIADPLNNNITSLSIIKNEEEEDYGGERAGWKTKE